MIEIIAKLLHTDASLIQKALLCRTIDTRQGQKSIVTIKNNQQQVCLIFERRIKKKIVRFELRYGES